MNKFKVGILGATGFIGKALVNLLIKDSTFDLFLFSRKIDYEYSNNPQINQIKFDIQKSKIIPKEMFEIDIMYYLISETIPSTSWNNSKQEITNNLIPFVHLIEQLNLSKLKKIVYTSSAGTIYGSSKNKLNERSETLPFSPYGITKLTIEHFLNYFQIKQGINYDIYRISNIYGPGQNTSKGLGLINTIIENHINNNETIIFGDGESIRNYIYIDDVVEILKQSIYSNLIQSDIINLASSDNISILELVSIIEKLIHQKLRLRYENPRISDNPCISIDNTKLKNKHLNFKFTDLNDGILKTYDSLLRSKDYS
jgi:UDP-glucose 4-epimerase